MNKDKTVFGFAMGMFFSLLGLLGVLMWSEGSKERETFIKGWVCGFVFTIIATSILIIIYVFLLSNFINNLF